MKKYLLVFALFCSLALPAHAAYNPSGGGTYRLQSSIGLANVTVPLSSFKEPISNIAYTMAYLNSSIGYGTLDPQNPNRSEFISFTGITQNSDGTAVLTGVTRGLARSYPFTASATFIQPHSGQSIFILSDSPQHFEQYAVKANDETITGSWTIPEPLAASNPASKNYVDTHVNGGAVSINQVIIAGTAGETVSAGQVLYLRQSDARWYKAGTAIPEASSTILAIAQGAGTAGNPVSGGVLTNGLDANQSGLTSGMNYFLSAVPGTIGIATTTRYVGRARTPTTLYFDTYSSNQVQLAGTNAFTGANSFPTSTTMIGAFPAYSIGKNVKIFTQTGTSSFPIPLGVAKIYVKVQGGGGAGGASSASSGNQSAAGGGGGAGGYAEGFIDVSATTSVQVYVGTAGQWSTFGTSGFYASSTPGLAGTAAPGISVSAAGGAGGIGHGGDLQINGQNGGYGAGEQTSTADFAVGGSGANSMLGFGGAQVIASQTQATAGVAGTGYGSGGGGGVSTNGAGAGAGGNGAQGIVEIIW